MQLNKQNRRAARAASKPRSKFIKLESFNPVMKPGVQIISVSTVHNLERATHLTITTVRASDEDQARLA